MLSFLLLASSTGQPLPADAAARCSRLPVRDLTFVPTASTTWRSDDGHVLLVGSKAKLQKKCVQLRNLLSHYHWRLTGTE